MTFSHSTVGAVDLALASVEACIVLHTLAGSIVCPCTTQLVSSPVLARHCPFPFLSLHTLAALIVDPCRPILIPFFVPCMT